MSIGRSVWIIIPIWCFAPVGGWAQQDRRITLDVVVSDKSGKAVAGLQEQDFTLLDNKQPQRILSFQAVGGASAAADPPVETLLVIDEVNLPFTKMADEREQIEKFLERDGGALAHPMSVAFLTDSGATMGNKSSRDGKALAEFVNKQFSGLRTVGKAQGVYGAEERLRISLRGMQDLVNYEGSRAGRKLVVWVSPGWALLAGPQVQLTPKQEAGIFNSIVGISDGLRRARMTIYAVDPLGVMNALQAQRYREFLKGVKVARQAQMAHLGLQVLAEQSGGRVLNTSNDLAAEIAECVADANGFYVLSFDGIEGDGPNEYHGLEVRIDKPGLRARTRSGYYAQP
jgi:VWFA-related protein